VSVFGAKAQVVVGVIVFVVGLAAWALGTFVIPGAKAWPWHWQPVAFVFHISMFYGEAACYAIIATGLGFRATERVESQVSPG
jgi:hypothetical protein